MVSVVRIVPLYKVILCREHRPHGDEVVLSRRLHCKLGSGTVTINLSSYLLQLHLVQGA